MKGLFFHRCLCLLLLLALCFSCAGCGVKGSIYANYRELDQLRLIRALGYDTSGAGVTLSASTGKQGENGESLSLCRSGENILKAMDSLQAYSTEGRLFFSHIQHVVAGREAAERGLGPLLDFVERDVRTRLDTELFILCEGTASSLLMNPGDDSYDATELLSSVKQDTSLRAVSRVSNFRETAVALSEYGAALVCLLRPVTTEGSVRLEEPGLTAVPVGYAILKDGSMVGVLEGRQAEAASLFLGYPGTVIREFSMPGGTVILRISGTGAEIRPSWQNGTPALDITLRVTTVLSETEPDPSQTGQSFSPDPGALEGAVEQMLTENLQDVIACSKSLDADFLALAKQLRRGHKLPSDWLRNLNIRITVSAAADRGYDLYTPMELKGDAHS